jgi:hypothetical protein
LLIFRYDDPNKFWRNQVGPHFGFDKIFPQNDFLLGIVDYQQWIHFEVKHNIMKHLGMSELLTNIIKYSYVDVERLAF